MTEPTQTRLSAFTLIRNATLLDFPLEASIASVLPVVDEFVVNVGHSEDDTLARVRAIGDSRVRIIESTWDPALGPAMLAVETQRAMAACRHAWGIYIQADEVCADGSAELLRRAIERHHADATVDGVLVDYLHFYGGFDTVARNRSWYRREVRIMKNNIRVIFPNDAQYPILLLNNKRSRYLKAVACGAKMYHYGWVQSEFMRNGGQEKTSKCQQIDPETLHHFKGSHPGIMRDLLKLEITETFQTDRSYKLDFREKRHRVIMFIERLTGFIFYNNKHFIPVKN